jgi:formylglycine-generating enzyme required for sulfatase activity
MIEQSQVKQKSITVSPGMDIAMIYVPAGKFIMGAVDDDYLAKNELGVPDAREVHLGPYWISKYPITVAQFAAFVRTKRYRTLAEKEGHGYAKSIFSLDKVTGATWQSPFGPSSNVADKGNHPVNQVGFQDVLAFCRWLSRISSIDIRLPTEAEWEKAARSTDGRIFPWGNSQDVHVLFRVCNCNMNVEDTTPVGKYSPSGDSPYGCVDMLGNVDEWTSDQDTENYIHGYDVRQRTWHITRGGGFATTWEAVRCAARHQVSPKYRSNNLGFRICATHL